MFIRLIPVFTLLPILELYLLIRVGSAIGAGAALLLVLGTGVLGAFLARQEGFRVWMNIQNSMRQGLFPADEMIDGLLIFAAGILLVTPGIMTDCVGILLLIPFTRSFFKGWLKSRFGGMIQRGDSNFSGVFWNGQRPERDVTDSGEDRK